MLYVTPPGLRSATEGVQTPAAKQHMAAQELERFFVYTLLREMRKTVMKDSLLDGGQQRAIFEDMMNDALAGQVTKSGQWGIADMIEKQFQTAEIRGKIVNLNQLAGETRTEAGQDSSSLPNVPIKGYGASGSAQTHEE